MQERQGILDDDISATDAFLFLFLALPINPDFAFAL